MSSVIHPHQHVFDNGQGKRVGSAFANKGERWQWVIMDGLGFVKYRSTMLGSGGGGYYDTPSKAMQSLKRVARTLAQ